jgi:hypothetical protein
MLARTRRLPVSGRRGSCVARRLLCPSLNVFGDRGPTRPIEQRADARSSISMAWVGHVGVLLAGPALAPASRDTAWDSPAGFLVIGRTGFESRAFTASASLRTLPNQLKFPDPRCESVSFLLPFCRQFRFFRIRSSSVPTASTPSFNLRGFLTTVQSVRIERRRVGSVRLVVIRG